MSDHEAVGPETTDGGGLSRRGFIAGAAGLTGVALSGVWRGRPASADSEGIGRAVPPAAPLYAFLEIDGTNVGSVRSFSGGNLVGEVVAEPPDEETGLVDKHIDGVKYEDIDLRVGLGMAKPMYDWIAAFCAGTDPGHEGAIVLADQNLQQKSRTDFQGWIHEVGFPSLDGASKEPAYLKVKILPFESSTKSASGPVGTPKSNQNLWLPANFQLDIAGLDTTKVNGISAFAVTQELFDNLPSAARFTLPRPVVGDLGFRFAQSSIKGWTAHLDAFLKGEAGELEGQLDVKNPTLSTVLASVGLERLGLYRLDQDPVPSPADTIRRVQARMYCEEVSFTFRPK